MQGIKRLGVSSVWVFGLVWATPAFSFIFGCELVAKMAGPAYEIRNQRIATMSWPENIPDEFGLTLIEQSGAWSIFQADSDWFDKSNCGVMSKASSLGKKIEFAPVLFNRQTGVNAVINGTFLIKTYHETDIDKIAEQYGFIKLTQLPNRFTAIFDVKPQVSYDLLLQKLDRDKNIEVAAPLLSEARYRLR